MPSIYLHPKQNNTSYKVTIYCPQGRFGSSSVYIDDDAWSQIEAVTPEPKTGYEWSGSWEGENNGTLYYEGTYSAEEDFYPEFYEYEDPDNPNPDNPDPDPDYPDPDYPDPEGPEQEWVTYTITFDFNGGQANGVPSTLSGEANLLGDAAFYTDLPSEIPIKDGATFLGWRDPQTLSLYSPGEFFICTGDITLYAEWDGGEDSRDWTVYLALYDSDGSFLSKWTYSITEDTPIVDFPYYIDGNRQVEYWSGETQSYWPGDYIDFSHNGQTITLVAGGWIDIDVSDQTECAVKYNFNGGNDPSGLLVTTSLGYVDDSGDWSVPPTLEYTIPNVIPVKENATFKGWRHTEYTNDGDIEAIAQPGDTIWVYGTEILKAVWEITILIKYYAFNTLIKEEYANITENFEDYGGPTAYRYNITPNFPTVNSPYPLLNYYFYSWDYEEYGCICLDELPEEGYLEFHAYEEYIGGNFTINPNGYAWNDGSKENVVRTLEVVYDPWGMEEVQGYYLDITECYNDSLPKTLYDENGKIYQIQNLAPGYDYDDNGFPVDRPGYRVEIPDLHITSLTLTFPYKEPAYQYIKIDNVWKKGILYLKIDNQWKKGNPHVKISNSWK